MRWISVKLRRAFLPTDAGVPVLNPRCVADDLTSAIPTMEQHLFRCQQASRLTC